MSAFADRTKFIWREVQRKGERERERGRRAYREIEKVFVFFLGRNLILAKFITTRVVRLFYIYDGLVFLNKPNQATNCNKNCSETVWLIQ